MTDYPTLLRSHHLRPTRQRLQLSEILFDGQHRHLSAEQLHGEIKTRGGEMSLATIYNTLNQFTEVGLLREIKLEDGISYFDTNNDHHHHFYDPKTGELIDIPHEQITIAGLPNAPEGKDIDRVDVIIRVC
ncbi:MAG: iron response transcriptional regulator IrrA [Candidatus Puniceispirillales bacterium]